MQCLLGSKSQRKKSLHRYCDLHGEGFTLLIAQNDVIILKLLKFVQF